jgi:hypothetical protein
MAEDRTTNPAQMKNNVIGCGSLFPIRSIQSNERMTKAFFVAFLPSVILLLLFSKIILKIKKY